MADRQVSTGFYSSRTRFILVSCLVSCKSTSTAMLTQFLTLMHPVNFAGHLLCAHGGHPLRRVPGLAGALPGLLLRPGGPRPAPPGARLRGGGQRRVPAAARAVGLDGQGAHQAARQGGAVRLRELGGHRQEGSAGGQGEQCRGRRRRRRRGRRRRRRGRRRRRRVQLRLQGRHLAQRRVRRRRTGQVRGGHQGGVHVRLHQRSDRPPDVAGGRPRPRQGPHLGEPPPAAAGRAGRAAADAVAGGDLNARLHAQAGRLRSGVRQRRREAGGPAGPAAGGGRRRVGRSSRRRLPGGSAGVRRGRGEGRRGAEGGPRRHVQVQAEGARAEAEGCQGASARRWVSQRWGGGGGGIWKNAGSQICKTMFPMESLSITYSMFCRYLPREASI